MNSLQTIGSKVLVSLPDQSVSSIPAKVDTGADSSSIWASDIHEQNGILRFVLFDKGAAHYTGQPVETGDYTHSRVKSSFGDTELRYKVPLAVHIDGQSFTTVFTLANRHRNRFPILVGRRALQGRFVVDVSLELPQNSHAKKEARI